MRKLVAKGMTPRNIPEFGKHVEQGDSVSLRLSVGFLARASLTQFLECECSIKCSGSTTLGHKG